MKKCISCKVPKVLNEFHGNKHMKSDRINKCKCCCKKARADRIAGKKSEPKAKGRVAKLYGPYKGEMITMKQIMALSDCKYSRPAIFGKLKEGKTIEEIICPPTKEEREAKNKSIRDEQARQRVQDKQIIKKAKEEQSRKRALKIMSVPVDPKKTQEYYMMKAYTYTSNSDAEPIKLTKGGGY